METYEKLLYAIFKKKIENDLEIFGRALSNGNISIKEIKYEGIYTLVQSKKESKEESQLTIMKSLTDLNLPFFTEKTEKEIIYEIETTDEEINKLFVKMMENSNQDLFKKNIDKINNSESKRKKALAPLESVFFSNEIINEVLLKTSIPDLLKNETPKYPGTIFFGPPGTGKTVLEKAIAQIYENTGAYAQELKLSSELSEKWVGSRGKSLEDKILVALNESKNRGLPSMIYLDEATTLMRNNTERTGIDNYYQEGLDVMKKYIGNYPELVFMITTNDDEINFDAPIIREGRLTPIKINYPKEKERMNMWRYFIEKNIGIKFTSSNYQTLAKITPEEQGAFIEQITRTYLGNIENFYFKEKNINRATALLKNIKMPKKEIQKALQYKNFKKNILNQITPKKKQKTYGF